MLKAFVRSCLFAGCVVSFQPFLTAQEVVHALTGTVSSINTATRTITVFQDDGAKGVYDMMSNPKTRIAFDKKIEAETTAADVFTQSGAYAIVFYFGETDKPTVAALKSLGAGPFTSIEGKVERFDKGDHSISVEDKSGKVQTFKINADTVAETNFGVEEGLKFHAQAGEQVRVVSSTENGTATALFLREM